MKTKYRLQSMFLVLSLALLGGRLPASPMLDGEKPGKVADARKAVHARNTRVRMGDSLLLEFHADHIVQASMRVVNATGKVVYEHPIVLGAGANCLKMRFGEVPAGVYFIKVESSLGTETMTAVLH